ncbi:hypothetical protein GCK32_000674 [Trichostrongylus colubriformis]|uniref:Uncharacterized protein n=1 Tax=Trichostrongylus colubriformis TaxID=6319 RepID=A0AAN8FRE6_TRICO
MNDYEILGPVPGAKPPPAAEDALPLRCMDSVRLGSDEGTEKNPGNLQQSKKKNGDGDIHGLDKLSEPGKGATNGKSPKAASKNTPTKKHLSDYELERCILVIVLYVIVPIFIFALATTVMGVLHIFEFLTFIEAFVPKNCPV